MGSRGGRWKRGKEGERFGRRVKNGRMKKVCKLKRRKVGEYGRKKKEGKEVIKKIEKKKEKKNFRTFFYNFELSIHFLKFFFRFCFNKCFSIYTVKP